MHSLHPDGYRVSRGGKVLHIEKGSTEHFFHFLLGYLLPAVWLGIKSGSKIRVLDCGPLMNGRLEEALNSSGLKWEYWRGWKPWAKTVSLPRWDLSREPFEDFQNAVLFLSRALEGAPNCVESACETKENLFLIRSPEPSFYGPAGPAILKGYGIGRREISNREEIINHLGAVGSSFSVYQPGAHSLRCQMKAFGSAKKVFGVRGAEWANLIWMNKETSACVVFEGGTTTPFAPALARDLRISLHSIVGESAAPHVDPVTVEKYFSDALPEPRWNIPN